MTRFAEVGFVGCGSHATNNIYPMLKYARCNLDAVCDLDGPTAHRNARLFGAKAVYTDAVKMLEERKLDGVFVVGPPEMHYKVGREVLKRGIPLFVEKPPAPTLAETRDLAVIARTKETFFVTGFMKRHGLTYAKAISLIKSGGFTPATAFVKYSHWPNTDLRGMLLGMSSHAIDLALAFFDQPASVHPSFYKSERAISLAVTIRFKSGRHCQLMLDSSQPRIQERVEISGTFEGANALMIIDNVERFELHTHRHPGIDLVNTKTWQTAPLHEIDPQVELDDIRVWRPDNGIPNMGQTRHFFQGFAGEVRAFVDAVLAKREPAGAMDQAMETMRIIEAIVDSPHEPTNF